MAPDALAPCVDNVSSHQPRDCLLNRLFRRRSKRKSKLRVTGLGVGNSLGAGEFPAQMASNAGNVSTCDVIMSGMLMCKSWKDNDHMENVQNEYNNENQSCIDQHILSLSLFVLRYCVVIFYGEIKIISVLYLDRLQHYDHVFKFPKQAMGHIQ